MGPEDGDISLLPITNWGTVVPQNQSLVYAFSSLGESRTNQDVGLDGYDDIEEAVVFSSFADLSGWTSDPNQYYDIRRVVNKATSSGIELTEGDNSVLSDVLNVYTDGSKDQYEANKNHFQMRGYSPVNDVKKEIKKATKDNISDKIVELKPKKKKNVKKTKKKN